MIDREELRKSMLIAEELLPSSTYEEITTELARLELALKQAYDEREIEYRASLSAPRYNDEELLRIAKGQAPIGSFDNHTPAILAGALLVYQDRRRWIKAEIAGRVYADQSCDGAKHAAAIAESILVECGL